MRQPKIDGTRCCVQEKLQPVQELVLGVNENRKHKEIHQSIRDSTFAVYRKSQIDNDEATKNVSLMLLSWRQSQAIPITVDELKDFL